MTRSGMRRAKKKTTIRQKIGQFVISSQGLPLVLMFVSLGVLFVFVRMKSIEQHYVYNEVLHKIDELNTENKELKAKRAKMLSIKNLRFFAEKYSLKEPSQSQIIMIP